jgi:hypothetical protein
MLHGLAAECLHYQLRLFKRQALTTAIGQATST